MVLVGSNRFGCSMSISETINTLSARVISWAVSKFSIPIAPCVSTLIETLNLGAVLFSASAAMYVCAMPVGHAVTATILIIILGVLRSTVYLDR